MPVTVQGPDGNTYQFPDGTDKAAAIGYFKKKGIGAKANPSSVAGIIGKPTERERFLNPDLYPVGVKGEGVGENLHNLAQRAGVGVFQLADAAAHPRRTVGGMLASVLPEPVVKGVNKVVDLENEIPGMHYLTTKLPEGTENPIQSSYEAARPGGWQAAGNVAPTAGQIIAGGALMEAAPAVASDVKAGTPKAAGRVAEALTKTGPRETANLVKEMQAENEAATATAAEQTAKQQAKHAEDVAESEAERRGDVRKHFEKSQTAEKSNAANAGKVLRRGAIDRGLERLDTEFKGDLEAEKAKAHEAANKEYKQLSLGLDAIDANPDFLPSALVDATQGVSEFTSEPTLLKRMETFVREGNVPTYAELQELRTSLGRELFNKNLPSDVYRAYDKMQDAVDAEMLRIAESQGKGETLRHAQNSWREMKRTFYDPQSPFSRYLKRTGELKYSPGAGLSEFANSAAAIQQLAKYNPDLASRLNTIRNYRAEAKALPARPGKMIEPPKLPQKPPVPEAPPPVAAALKKIGPEDIREAKQRGLEQRTQRIRSRGEWIATGAAGYRALSNILHGNLAGVPGDLFEGGVAVAGVEGISRLLENPKVVEFLTRPTARDIAQVPPELRADMGQIAQIAAKKGVRVDPRLYVVAGAAQPGKRVGDILPKVQ